MFVATRQAQVVGDGGVNPDTGRVSLLRALRAVQELMKFWCISNLGKTALLGRDDISAPLGWREPQFGSCWPGQEPARNHALSFGLKVGEFYIVSTEEVLRWTRQ